MGLPERLVVDVLQRIRKLDRPTDSATLALYKDRLLVDYADKELSIWPAEDWPEYAYAEWNLVSLSQAAHDAMHDRQTGRLTELGESWRRRTIPPGEKF